MDRNAADDQKGSIIWLVLLSSALLHIPIQLPSVAIQITAFDIALPSIAGWLYWQGKLRIRAGYSILICGLVVASILCHSFAVYVFKSELVLSWLLKETLKAAMLAVEFFLVFEVIRSQKLLRPNFAVSMGTLYLGLLGVGSFSLYFWGCGLDPNSRNCESFFFARTIYCVALAALLFLSCADEKWTYSGRRRLALVLTGILITAVAILSLSKGMTGLALAMTAWIAFGSKLRSDSTANFVKALVGLTLIAIIGISAALLISGNIENLQRMDSIQRSISVRLSLWSIGLDSFWSTFPWGLGLGQLWQAIVQDIKLAGEGHKYLHNAFFSLMSGLGLLGLVFSSGLVVMICYALRGWPPMMRPLFAILVFAPLIIHDGQSIRLLLIVTALGLARYLNGNKSLEIS